MRAARRLEDAEIERGHTMTTYATTGSVRRLPIPARYGNAVPHPAATLSSHQPRPCLCGVIRTTIISRAETNLPEPPHSRKSEADL
jgi:hypothetical protein